MSNMTRKERICLKILHKKNRWMTAREISDATRGKLSKEKVQGELYHQVIDDLVETQKNCETSKRQYRITALGREALAK
jgi:DNA-binding PadR family transcriptional regulator